MGRASTIAAGSAALGLAAGCIFANPNFDRASATEGGDASSTDGATSMTASTTSSTASTSSSHSSTTSTSQASTSEASASATTDASTSGDPGSSGAESTSDGSSSSGSTSGGVEPGTYAVPASIATCVLFDNGSGYGPPSTCSANADALNGGSLVGLMEIDNEVSSGNGLGRRAESFLRFDIPAEYMGNTVASATLHVQVADSMAAAGNQDGTLYRASGFDEVSLQVVAPTVVEVLVANTGVVTPNEVRMWSIPTTLIVPGGPLYLGLSPVNTYGTVYRGATTPGSPTLELVLQ